MDGSVSMVQELKKKVAAVATQQVSTHEPEDRQATEERLPPSLLLRGIIDEREGVKAFASYIVENARQQSRVTLLRSCFLGRKEQMSDALQLRQVNDELPVPFYSWEYVIVFENPDYHTSRQKAVTLKAAESHFNTCFQGEMGELKYQQDINRQFERKAFLEAFNELPDSDILPQKWKYIHFSTPQTGKVRNMGGQLRHEEGKWVVQSPQPRDYLTLIRNVVQTKLSLHVGLKTRMLLSANGQYIYMLLLADELDLQNEAERVHFFMEMELGACDLDSLEPCDANLRPLTQVKKDGFEAILTSIKELQAEIYEEVKYLLVEENEECKCHLDVKLDSEGVGPEEWTAYREFLEYIREELTKLRDSRVPAHAAFRRHRGIILSAYSKVNAAHPKAKLYSLWDRMKIATPLAPFSRYVRDFDLTSSRDVLARRDYTDYWRRYRLDSPQSETLFSSADRVKLIDSMIMSQVNIKRLEKLKLVKTHFPLHRIWEIERPLYLPPQLSSQGTEVEASLNLKQQWKTSVYMVQQPLDRIREYFGEKIAFFFLYLHTYTLWIAVLAVVGAVFFFESITGIDRITNFEESELYCFITIAWSSLFLELWKRKQERYAIQWGQTSFEEVEIQRPEFRGKLRRSPINDDLFEVYYGSGKRLMYQALGIVIAVLFVILTALTIALILYERYRVRASGGIMCFGYELSGTLFGFLSAVQIEVFNRLFEVIALKTTELENYRLQSEFENSYIVKSYMYQMFNYYATIVYVAFFQSHFEGCYLLRTDGTKETHSCMYDLKLQLAMIYLTHFLYNCAVMGTAKWQGLARKKKDQEQEQALKRSWQADIHNPAVSRTLLDREFAKDSYLTSGIDGSFADYLELMMQYGYVTLFAVAFPLTPLMALLNNLFEMRVDRFKLLSMTRRPVPAGARGIGRWQTVLDAMTTMAVFSNSALLCFTLGAFEDWDLLPGEPIMWFAIMLISIYVMRKTVALVIPDVPHRFSQVKKRHEAIVEKHIKKYKPAKRVINIDSEWVNMEVVGTV